MLLKRANRDLWAIGRSYRYALARCIFENWSLYGKLERAAGAFETLLRVVWIIVIW